MGTIDCFLVEPSDEAEESLRRFSFSAQLCSSGTSYHNAEAVIGRVPWAFALHGRGSDDYDHGDTRWPKACACGYEFHAEDQWQHNFSRLWVRQGTNEKWLLSQVPPGAMWYADWYDGKLAAGPDGKVLVVKTPGGDWVVDAKSSNGPGWTRTGTPPNITVTPSILSGKNPDGSWTYHGWLTNGKLVDV